MRMSSSSTLRCICKGLSEFRTSSVSRIEVAEGVDLPAGWDRWSKSVCLFNFGLCCETGQGVAPSNEEALTCFREAASRGWEAALDEIARLSPEKGQGE